MQSEKVKSTVGEKIGYRVNAETPRTVCNNGFVNVFAERKNENATLGYYGGDAYPTEYEAVFNENKNDEFALGFVLDADGLGNGNFVHESLKDYLNDNTPGNFTGTDRDNAKLSLFLRKLYGKEIFEQKYSKALEYALSCFSCVPVDGFFAVDEAIWQKNENAQTVIPFFERDSQSLGSRIVCVALFKTLLDAVYDPEINNEHDFAAVAEKIRKKADKTIKDLRTAIFELFKYSDADARTVGRYFLPSTVAFWFYKYDKKQQSVNAVAVSVGDARCYALDTVNGVRQISVDDAAEDGDIASLVHYGNSAINNSKHFDNEFRARIIELKAPCALMACSDGVYDTCPHVKKQGDISFGNKEEAPSDIMFEKNLLDALRDCYSADDFKRKIVFEFYAQRAVDNMVVETGCSRGYMRTKRDDSGTLAARFFDAPVALFDALRKSVTSLDKLYDVIIEAKRNSIDIPYKKPHVKQKAERDESKLAEVAAKFMTNELQELLKKAYPAAFECMKANGSNMLWGVEHNNVTPLAGFSLGQFVKMGSVKSATFLTCLEDWKVCSDGHVPPEWKGKLHEHIITNADIYEYLKKIDFGALAKQTTGDGDDSHFDKLLELYAWFEKCFYGVCEKPRSEVWAKTDSERAEASIDEIKLIVEKYGVGKESQTATNAESTIISSPDTQTVQYRNNGTDDKGDKR